MKKKSRICQLKYYFRTDICIYLMMSFIIYAILASSHLCPQHLGTGIVRIASNYIGLEEKVYSMV